MKKIFSLILWCSLIATESLAQVNVTAFPQDLQLFPRNTSNDLATVEVSGTINSGHSFQEIKLVWYRDSIRHDSVSKSLTVGSADIFTFTPTIPAELHNYMFELYTIDNGNNSSLVVSADSVVAGDAFVIAGQSNAEAAGFDGSANDDATDLQRAFIRSFASGTGDKTQLQNNLVWYLADGDGSGEPLYINSYGIYPSDGNIGQWGMRMGATIVSEQGIPVAIINGAVGGTEIFSQIPASDPAHLNRIYGRTLYRTQNAGLENNIRAIFWYQGETDSGRKRSTADYRTYFDSLYSSWQRDYPGFEHLYVCQMRAGCCGVGDTCLKYQQLHVDLVEEINERYSLGDPGYTVPADILSTRGGKMHTDYCHHPYVGGYRLLGDWAYLSVARDFYGGTSTDVSPPKISSVNKSGSQITLEVENVAANSLTIGAGAENTFRAFLSDNSVLTPNNVSFSGTTLTLTFSSSVESVTSVALYDEVGPVVSPSLITNSRGMGLLTFSSSDFISSFPVEWLGLSLEEVNAGIEVRWATAQEIQNDRFEVLRSINDSAWEVVGQVPGQGNISEPTYYSYTDTRPKEGSHRYQIRQIDFDGNYSFSDQAEIQVGARHIQGWEVWPNPTNGELYVQLDADIPSSVKELVLQDMSGRVFQQILSPPERGGNYQLDMQDLPEGIYLIKMITEQNVWVRKVQKIPNP